MEQAKIADKSAGLVGDRSLVESRDGDVAGSAKANSFGDTGARVRGLTAVITGAGGGMGLSHCLRLASEGANIVALDLDRPGVGEALAGLVRQVRTHGGRASWALCDVRDVSSLSAAVDSALAELERSTASSCGRAVDVVVVNAGVYEVPGPASTISAETWQRSLDVNLTGAWNTVRAVEPHLADGASLIFVSSSAGIKGFAGAAQYTAAKHGLVGFARTLANELGHRAIRVNTIHPGSVATPMILNEESYGRLRPDLDNPTKEDAAEALADRNILPVPWAEAYDVSNCVLFLASPESRLVTGNQMVVDAGLTQKS